MFSRMGVLAPMYIGVLYRIGLSNQLCRLGLIAKIMNCLHLYNGCRCLWIILFKSIFVYFYKRNQIS